MHLLTPDPSCKLLIKNLYMALTGGNQLQTIGLKESSFYLFMMPSQKRAWVLFQGLQNVMCWEIWYLE